ncbi:NAC domain-containing protein 71-like [Rosa rugosa]|uniref:NAC domain-containing protein 71-like n=1 Tax=Rosa rugosa TaxID=74645 RepID=UPI002B402732|nr:NAC domain-containing protein 71-like [Rosa rugosa]
MTVKDLPVGFKFHPTDQELLGYYLRSKVSGEPFRYEPRIKSFDLYGKTEPWDIWTEFGGPELDQSEDLYFFTKLKKMGDSASMYRARRSGSGTWKGKNKGVTVYDSKNKKIVLGTRKLFHYENNESDQNRCWIMHEYSIPPSNTSDLPHEYVLCRIRINVDRRRKLVAKKVSQNHVNNEAIDHEYELEDQTTMTQETYAELNDINPPLEDNDAFNTSTDHVSNASKSLHTSQPLPSYHPKLEVMACETNVELTDHDNVHDYPLYEDYVFNSINVGDTHRLQHQSFRTLTETLKSGSYPPYSYPSFQRSSNKVGESSAGAVAKAGQQ